MKEWNTVYRDMLLALNTMSESIASAKTLFERDARAFDEIKEDGNNWKARAERAEVDLRELRENILLGFGMTTEEVAAIDDDLIDTTISYLLSGHAELVAGG